jgi:GR25 family glycosyltransferase involved in LPS biosynthesis
MYCQNFAKEKIKYNGINLTSCKVPNIYYINLLHRKDRKEFLLKDLKNINYENNRIHRIDAIKHNLGAIGCFASHIKALKIGLNENYGCEYIIILEDDFAIRNISITKTYLNKIFTEQLDWNVILLGVNGRCHKNNTSFLKKIIHSHTTSGYIIKKNYIPILLKLWEDLYYKIKDLNKKPWGRQCLDIHWKQLQHDRWFTTEPVLGYQRESYSDIEQCVTNYGV